MQKPPEGTQPDSSKDDPSAQDTVPAGAFVAGQFVARRYQIVRQLGRGGMGEVYEAVDMELNETIALKTVRQDVTVDSAGVGNLMQELQLARRVTHSNVCRVYDIGRHGESGRATVFITMELLDGETLASFLRSRGPLDPQTALGICRQIASALDAAHDCGIIHRDLKPGNVMLTSAGRVVITDFGLARIDSAGATLSHPTRIMGTPAYMAPEQLAGTRATTASDVYALGIVLYEMLTGKRPVDGDSRSAKEIPPSWRRAVERALSLDPVQRYKTAGEFIGGLHVRPVRSARIKHKWIAVVAALAFLVVILAYRELLQRKVTPPQIGSESTAALFITNFANTTGDRFFDFAPQQLLAIALEQSHQLSVSFGDIRQLTGTRLGIAGEVTGGNGAYRLVSRINNPSTGASTTLEERFQTRQDLRPAVDRLASRIRETLGEDRARVQATARKLADITTSSDSALELFSQAIALNTKADVTGAMLLLQKAVDSDHDPQFALAHEHLAVTLSGLGRRDAALESATTAYELRSKISEREQYLVSGTYHFLRDEFLAAADAYKTGTLRFSNDVLGYRYLAQVDSRLGRYDEGLAAVERLLELDPGSSLDIQTKVGLLMESGRFDAALRAADLARSKRLLPQYVNWTEALAFLAQDRVDDARAAFRELENASVDFKNAAQLYSTQIAMHEGDIQGAIDTLENQLQFDVQYQSGPFGALRRYWLAELYLVSGAPTRALTHIAALANQPLLATRLNQLRLAGFLYADAGRLDSARRTLSALIEIQSKVQRGEAPEAYVALVSGEIHRQLGQLDLAALDYNNARAIRNDPILLLSTARLLAQKTDYGRARELYQEFIRRHGEVLRWEPEALWVIAHFEEAQCEQRLHLDREAVHNYQLFLTLWEKKEPNLLSVRAARRELSKLQAMNISGKETEK
jgi:serine/threonine protein kinase